MDDQELTQKRDINDIINQYNKKYDEYKSSILKDTRFIDDLRWLYYGSIRVEKDFINENGVLWKIGLLGGLSGIFLSFHLFSDIFSLGTKILFGIIFLACVITIEVIARKFFNVCGKRIFLSYYYDKQFKDRVAEDKKKKKRELDDKIRSLNNFVDFRIDGSSKPNEETYKIVLDYIQDIEKLYNEFFELDDIAGTLKNDWYFNAEIHQKIFKDD